MDARLKHLWSLAEKYAEQPTRLYSIERRIRALGASIALNRPFGGACTEEQMAIIRDCATMADEVHSMAVCRNCPLTYGGPMCPEGTGFGECPEN